MAHLLDIDYRDGYIILWVTNGRRCTPRRRRYHPRIYLECPVHNRHLVASLPQVQHVQIEQKTTVLGREPEDLLALSLKDWDEAYSLADMLEQRGWRAYNVDLPPTRQFLLERGLFPMAQLGSGLCLDDDQQAMDYSLPELTTLTLQVVPETARNPCFSDPIREIRAGEHVLDGEEAEMIQNLTPLVRRLDPDVILTNGGDSFQLPYLYHRAQEAGAALQLGREKDDLPVQKKGRSYFSYGRIIYKPGGYLLRGRLHIDAQTFIVREGGMRGLIDLGRITGIPLQQLSRLSPGSAVTALQVTQALKDGVLVPWRRNLSEQFKTAEELLRSDRGALILEPRVGIYGNVAEMDFTSLFPHIMATRNISPETVLCECCPDSPQRVPFIGYHICQRRMGLIPRVIGPLVERRMTYKRRGEAPGGEEYRAVQNVLKWLLVTSFGYMGFNKARFGRIECHESITAYAREMLLTTMELAEGMGFEILHGIVDSLWVTGDADPRILCDRVSETVGIPLELKGHYHWIVFPSNRLNRAGALNRYFGLKTDGTLKVRGIELRRRDTPEFIRKLQQDMLDRMKAALTVDELYPVLPCVLDVVRRYACEILSGEADPETLVFTTHTRHTLEGYRQKGSQAAALYQLREEGVAVQPGQSVQYVHTDSRSRYYHERVKVAELVDPDTEYDREKYYQIMLRAAESIVRPFGYDRNMLHNVVMGSAQKTIKDFI